MQLLEAVPKEEGFSLAAWNERKVVAAASNQAFHQGTGIAPVLMLHEAQTGKLMPPNLAPQRQSVEQCCCPCTIMGTAEHVVPAFSSCLLQLCK